VAGPGAQATNTLPAMTRGEAQALAQRSGWSWAGPLTWGKVPTQKVKEGFCAWTSSSLFIVFGYGRAALQGMLDAGRSRRYRT
jgi:hypothetical protein